MTFNVKEWAEEFFKQPVEHMAPDVATAFMAMVIAEVENSEDHKRQAVIEQQFLYQVVEAKCAKHNLSMTKYAKMFMFALVRNPAEVTMYVVALRASKKANTVTMERLGWLFPNGFLTEQSMSNMWDKQKYKPQPGCIGDNSLDLLSGDF